MAMLGHSATASPARAEPDAMRTGQGDHPDLVVPRARVRGRRSRLHATLARAAGPVIILLAWWAASASGLLRPDLLASPATVAKAARELWDNGQLSDALAVSLGRAGAGLAIGVSVGLLLGLIAGSSRWGDDVVDSAMQTLRALPFLSLVPLFMVWFGIGETARVVLIAVATTFPMYVSAAGAVRATDPKLLEAAQVLGLSRWSTARLVTLPGALPSLFSGLRLSATLSVIALIAAEEINSTSGLGYLMAQAQNFSRTDILTVCILIYGSLGLVADSVIRLLERLSMPWLRREGGRA